MSNGDNQLPTGWTSATLGELIGYEGVFVDGDWVESKDQDPSGSVRLIQLADIGDGYFRDRSARFLTYDKAIELGCTFLESGDLLIARMPDPLGRCCIFPFRGQDTFVTVVDVCIIRLGSSPINPKYLLYAINSGPVRAQIAAHQSGSTRKRISRGNLSTIELPIAPLAEQDRIVAKIEVLFSELDNGIANLQTAHEQLQVYRQAVLKHAFAGELTSLWRKRNNQRFGLADVAADVSETVRLPPLSDGWKYVTLGQLIDEPKYGTSKKCAYDADGWGVLRIPNIVSGAIDDSDLKFAQFDDAEAEAYRLLDGDILVIRSNGSVSIVGRCAVVSEREEKYLYAGYLIRIRPNTSLVRPEFLHAALSSHALRVQIEAKAKSTSGVNNINAQELKSLVVPICSLGEQDELLSILSRSLSVADEMSSEIEHQRAKAEALRQAILKKAFSGQLAAQNPKDEPASVLLESIKAEKQTNKTKKKEAA